MTRRAVVIVSSTRAAAGVYSDESGPKIVSWLTARGFAVDEPLVVADGAPFLAALEQSVNPIGQSGPADLVITTGGTGISTTDETAELTSRVLDYEIPGIAEEIRRRGAEKIATAILSRGMAGVAGRTLVLNLPGSGGGVKDGLAVLDGVLDHALDQLAGGDHVRSGGV